MPRGLLFIFLAQRFPTRATTSHRTATPQLDRIKKFGAIVTSGYMFTEGIFSSDSPGFDQHGSSRRSHWSSYGRWSTAIEFMLPLLMTGRWKWILQRI